MKITDNSLSSLFTGFKGNFNKGFEGAETAWQTVAMKVPSQTREETYGWLGQVPRLREWLGDRQIKQLTAHGYKIKNRSYEDTIEVPKDDIEDDQYGIFAPLFEEMGRAAAELPDELVFGLLRDGFTGLCYDGKPFFSEEHPLGEQTGKPTAVSNMQAGELEPWFLLDTSKAMRPLIYQERRPFDNLVKLDDPTQPKVFFEKKFIYGVDGRGSGGHGLWQLAFASQAALTKVNYSAARATMRKLHGDEGGRLNIRPTLLVVGPDNEEAALSLINPELVNGGDSNPWKSNVEVLVTSWVSNG